MPRARSCSVCVWGLFSCLCGGSQSSATNTLCQIIRQAKKHPSLSPSSRHSYQSRGYWSNTRHEVPGIVQSRCQLGQEEYPALGTNWVLMNRFYPVYMGCSNLKKDGPRLTYQVLYRIACGQDLLKDIHTVLHLIRKHFSSECMKSG